MPARLSTTHRLPAALAALALGATSLLAGCGDAEQQVRDSVEREVNEQVDRQLDDAGKQLDRGREQLRDAQDQLRREADRLKDTARDLGGER